MSSGFAGQGYFLGGVVVAYGAVALFAAGCGEASRRSDAAGSAGSGSPPLADAGLSGRGGWSEGGSSFDAGVGAPADASTMTDAAATDASTEEVPSEGDPAATPKARWISLGAPQAPPIGAFAIADDDTLFAGTDSPNGGPATGGMFFTADGGNAWHFSSQGLSGSGTSSIAVASSGVFASIGYTLFRSRDHGLSWQKSGVTGYTVAAQGNLVVVADPYYAISTDGGQTFTKGSTQAGTTTDDVAVVGDVILRTTNGSLTRSSDRGVSFAPVQFQTEGVFSNVSLECDHARTCYAVAFKDPSVSLYRSTDAGATWTDLGREVSRILAVTDEGSVYVRNSSQVIERSDDGGKTWQACPDPALVASCNRNLLSARGDRVFASCASGVYRSDDRGAHWVLAIGSQATGALTDAATMLFVDRSDAARSRSGDIYVGAPIMRSNQLVSSIDEGKSWKATNALSATACASSDKHTIICSTNGTISRSEDQGATWTKATVDFEKSGTLVAAGSSGIYLAGDGKGGVLCRSDDDGRSFLVVGGAPYTTSLQVLRSGHLLRQGGRIAKSVDRGETWTEAAWQVDTLPVPEDAEGRLYVGMLGKLQVSNDEGDSWMPLADVPPNSHLVPSSRLVRDSQGRFYLNPSNGNVPGIFSRGPGASTWETLPASPSPNILQLAFDNRDRLLAATSAGLYRFASE